MKNIKKQVQPLIHGSTIARRTVTLGMGHVAQITITYDGPTQSMPAAGCQWDSTLDYPAAGLTVCLPSHQHGHIHPDLVCAAMVCGEDLISGWGTRQSTAQLRQRDCRASAPNLRDCAARMLRQTMAELRPLQAHLAARQARIDQRAATLAYGILGVHSLDKEVSGAQ